MVFYSLFCWFLLRIHFFFFFASISVIFYINKRESFGRCNSHLYWRRIPFQNATCSPTPILYKIQKKRVIIRRALFLNCDMFEFSEFVWGIAEVKRDLDISLQSVGTSISTNIALEALRALVLARPDVGKRKLSFNQTFVIEIFFFTLLPCIIRLPWWHGLNIKRSH